MTRAIAALIALTANALPALAQSSPSDFRLPTASPTATPRVQGPVDSDVPVITAPRPSPRPTPTEAPATAPSAAPTTPAPAVTPRATVRPVPTAAAPRPAQTGRVLPPAATAATSSPIAPTTDQTGSALPSQAAPVFSTESAPTAPPAESPALETGASFPDWLPLAAGLLLGLVGAAVGVFVWRRRRSEAPVEVEFERPIVPDAPAARPLAEPAAKPVAPLAAAPAAPQPVAAAPSPALFEQDGLELALEARRMSASLMATTLSYRLVLTNRSDRPLSALAIEGDMIAAHGQLPPERQVANRTQKLELRHALPELAPGESAEFTGDIRVPLSQITPIRSGDLALFVPLARFRVDAGTVVVAQTFVIGETAEDPGASLRPFRLDLGPRNYSRIGQRAVG